MFCFEYVLLNTNSPVPLAQRQVTFWKGLKSVQIRKFTEGFIGLKLTRNCNANVWFWPMSNDIQEEPMSYFVGHLKLTEKCQQFCRMLKKPNINVMIELCWIIVCKNNVFIYIILVALTSIIDGNWVDSLLTWLKKS